MVLLKCLKHSYVNIMQNRILQIYFHVGWGLIMITTNKNCRSHLGQPRHLRPHHPHLDQDDHHDQEVLTKAQVPNLQAHLIPI